MGTVEELHKHRSQHADCPACGQVISLRYERDSGSLTVNGTEWRCEIRQCSECGYEDAAARYAKFDRDKTVFLTLANNAKECFACGDTASITVVELVGNETTNNHFCREHSSDEMRDLHHELKRITMEAGTITDG